MLVYSCHSWRIRSYNGVGPVKIKWIKSLNKFSLLIGDLLNLKLPNTQPERCTHSEWAEQWHLARMVYDSPYTDIVHAAIYSLDHNLSINYAKIVEWNGKGKHWGSPSANWSALCHKYLSVVTIRILNAHRFESFETTGATIDFIVDIVQLWISFTRLLGKPFPLPFSSIFYYLDFGRNKRENSKCPRNALMMKCPCYIPVGIALLPSKIRNEIV